MSVEDILKTAGDNPMAAMMATLAQQQPNDQDKELKQTRRRLKHSRQALKAMRNQVREAEHVLQELAAIFGACARCWGQDHECPDCQGTGGPGSQMPSSDELLALTEPALARLDLCIEPRKQATTSQLT
ncbi:MAG: hypothetical protein AB2604_01535 [Candidatus Thiodiazotropha taylori]